MSSRLIVQRQHNFDTGSDKGSLIPIAFEHDNSTIELVKEGDFPNNDKIWISKDFTIIESNFRTDEIFYLNTWRDTLESRNDSQDEVDRINFEKQSISEDRNKSRYFALGSNASRIDNGYLPIIKLPHLPDLNSGRYISHIVPEFPSIGVPFFVLVDAYIYGPFQIKKDSIDGVQEDVIFETVNRITPLSLQNNYIAKFLFSDVVKHKLLLRVSSSDNELMFLTNLHNVKKHIDFEALDRISDSGLINYFIRNDFFKENALSKNAANTLKAAIDTAIRKGHIAKTANLRIERLKNILDDFLLNDSSNYELIRKYLNSNDGERFLNDFLDKHQTEILKKQIEDLKEKNKKELEDIETSHISIKQNLEDKLVNEKQIVERKIIELRAELKLEQENLEEQRSEKDTANMTKEAEELSKLILEKEANLEELVEKHGEYEKIDQLLGRRSGLESDIKTYENKLDSIKKAIQKQSVMLQNPETLIEAAVGITTIKSIMGGTTHKTEEDIYKLKTLPPAAINVTGETRVSYINYLQNEINNAGERSVSYNETANLLVSVMQNYLTIFNGMPGVGKTSTINNFANALKINPSEGHGNFLNVAVGRGWMSSKDLLGNKNALRQTYEEGRTGIYRMLKALEQCKGENEINSKMLSLILLDEANLSPMEHYWSDFLSICDTFENEQTLNLGGSSSKYSLKIPSSLRFMATINTDATVEPLSDRLLDRACVITLGYEENITTATTLLENELFQGAVPYKELSEAFMIDRISLAQEIKDGGKLSSDINIIEEISHRLSKDIVNTSSIHISPRKLKSIYSYCAVANDLDYKQASPIDFAIAQHILPKVKGQGKGFKDRLIAVDQILTDSRLLHSKRLLKKIMESGSEYIDTFSLL